MTTTPIVTPAMLATRLGIDSKALRRFLRSSRCTVEAVGNGGRYQFTEEEADRVVSQFSGKRGRKDTPKSKSPKAREQKQMIEAEFDDIDLELLDLELENFDDLTGIDEAHL